MAQQTENAAIDRLAVFVGEWGMAVEFKDLPPADIGARVVFEWMAGRRFLIQRWEVPVPEAPDGIAIIGAPIPKARATSSSTTSTRAASPACTRWV
jgi:hypothetical protein